MYDQLVTLTVPACPDYAPSVRMLAANLAAMQGLSLEITEDIKVLTEEAFIYACAAHPQTLGLMFEMTAEGLTLDVLLGEVDEVVIDESEELDFTIALLNSLCDTAEILELEDELYLHVTKKVVA